MPFEPLPASVLFGHCCVVVDHRFRVIASRVLVPVSSHLTESDAGDSDDDDVDCGQCPEGAHGAAAK